MESKKGKKRTRLFQYLMLLVLFAAAYLLPAYGARRQAANLQESGTSSSGLTSEKAGMQDADVENSKEDSDQGNGAQDNGADENAEDLRGNGANEASEGAGAAPDLQTIVIDPGHGGFDSGMVGISGANERILNLIYAQKLAALLEAEGFEVVLTRETEDGLYDADASNKKAQDMERRVAKIAEENPVLTVSIHQNSYPEDSSVKGPQVFYYEQSAEGEKLAAAIQESLNTELEIERPRTQKGNTTYYILKRSVSTTVIVECGFLTNPEEEALLQEETYQDRVAQAICNGILKYLTELNIFE